MFASFLVIGVINFLIHNLWFTTCANSCYGAPLVASGGPKATCVGCAGFAAFSVVIEKFLERHS